MMEDDATTTGKDSSFAETKSITNPRVEIDTSAPFESVKEAVDRFGGSGPWIPIHLLRLASRRHENEGFDVSKIGEQAAELEKDLAMKEHQTLNVLKQLEAAKKSVEELKLNFVPELSSFIASPLLECGGNSNSLCSSASPGFVLMELDRAKLNLHRASIDLAFIQESVESLNTKMQRGKNLLERRRNNMQEEMTHRTNIEAVHSPCGDVSATMSSFETEQFSKMTEASRYEVVRAMTEIERTKNSIKMAEMRLNAAKKMEEAAKAMEAIAVAKALLREDEDRVPNTRAEELCKNKFIDDHLEAPVLEKFKEIIKEENTNTFCREVHHHRIGYGSMLQENTSSVNDGLNENTDSDEGNDKSESGFRSAKSSIGDILSGKLILQDGDGSQRRHVSLSQMLKEQSRVILHHHHHPSEKSTADQRGSTVEKLRFVQRKKFGFIQVPVLSRQSKKQSTTLNMR